MHALAFFLLAATNVLTLVTATEPGARLHVAGTVRDRAGRPVAGAIVHVYQTDASGRYTLDKPMDEPHARLSGRLITRLDGTFEVRTIRPGGYPQLVHLGEKDRHIPAHLHIDVTAAGHPERRLQVVFSDDSNLRDPYWKHWAENPDHPTVIVSPEGGGSAVSVTMTLQ